MKTTEGKIASSGIMGEINIGSEPIKVNFWLVFFASNVLTSNS